MREEGTQTHRMRSMTRSATLWRALADGGVIVGRVVAQGRSSNCGASSWMSNQSALYLVKMCCEGWPS